MKPFLIAVALFAITFSLAAQTPGLEWEKIMGGSAMDQVACIKQTTDSGYIVAGTTLSNDNDVSGNHGLTDYWVVKLDKNHSMQWQKTLGGTTSDYVRSIQQTSDGGYIVAGNTYDSTYYFSHCLILKLNTSGDIEWQKSFGDSVFVFSVCIVNDGGYVLMCGNRAIKLNASGDFQWQTKITTDGSNSLIDVSPTNDGGCVAVGQGTPQSFGLEDLCIVKLGAGGEIQWQKLYGGTGTESAQSIQQTNDGGYILAGTSNSTDGDVMAPDNRDYPWIIKLAAVGAIEWKRIIEEGSKSCNIHQTTDGGYVFSCFSYWDDGESDYQSYGRLIKLDETGNHQWRFDPNWFLYHASYEMFIQQDLDGGFIIATNYNSRYNWPTTSPPYESDDYHIFKLSLESIINLCPPTSSTSFSAPVAGLSDYSWVVNKKDGAGFKYIENNQYYSGVKTSTLQLTNVPSSTYGYQYRCIAGSKDNRIHETRFADTWKGAVNTSWKEPANWSCGVLPDGNTDVVVPNGKNVLLNSNGICRSFTVNPGATFTVNPDKTLTITH